MTEKTPKHSHEDKCPAKQPKPTTPVVKRTKSKEEIAIEEEVKPESNKQEPTPSPEQPVRMTASELRQSRTRNRQ